MPAAVLCPELIAPVANMLAAAWAAGPAQVVAPEVRARQESTGAPVPGGANLRAPVDAGPGTRSRRVDRAAVCAGRGSGPVGLGSGGDRGDRHRSGDLGAFHRGPRRV